VSTGSASSTLQHGYFVSRAFDETLMLGLRSAAAAAAVNVTRSFSLSEGFGGVKMVQAIFQGSHVGF
jgi:hypothetical protein